MYAFMKYLQAIYIINTTHIYPQQCPNYNEGMTLAPPKVHLCNVKLASHNTNPTKHPFQTTFVTTKLPLHCITFHNHSETHAS